MTYRSITGYHDIEFVKVCDDIAFAVPVIEFGIFGQSTRLIRPTVFDGIQVRPFSNSVGPMWNPYTERERGREREGSIGRQRTST